MGNWGMGIAQSDQYCEVYEEFMEEYDKGKSVPEISNKILKHYLDEFDSDDGILHDVYFGLAKAEWMCCEQSEKILGKVRYIVENDLNIDFFRELEATETDLKTRKRNLVRFLKSLETPKASPRKRHIKKRQFPPLEIGDCFAYKVDGGYRVVIILDKREESVYACILKGTYKSFEINFMDEVIAGVSGYGVSEFLPKSKIQKIGTVKVYENIDKMSSRIFGKIPWLFGGRTIFYREFVDKPSSKLSDLLIPPECN